MAYSSSIGPFDEKAEVWENYEIRFDAWLGVNNVTDDADKRCALIAEIGPTTFAVLKDLTFPEKASDKSYIDLILLLRSHYQVTTTPMANRLKLHHRKQTSTENLSEYIASLKRIASNCSFGNELENRLRDSFLFGVKEPRILKRLLEESLKPGFTWQSATTLALSMEIVDKDVKGFQSPDDQDVKGNVNRMSVGRGRGRQNFRGNRSSRGRNQSVSYRGGSSQNFGSSNSSQGYASSNSSQNFASRQSENSRNDSPQDTSRYVCYQCGQRGHIRRNCPNRRQGQGQRGFRHGRQNFRTQSQRVRYVEPETESDSYVNDDLSESFQHLFSLTVNNVDGTSAPLAVPSEYSETLLVNEVPVKFVIDTACPVTLIPAQLFDKLFDKLTLKRANLKLCSYSKHSVPVRGCADVMVMYKGAKYCLKLYVAEGNETSLLGRQWLEAIKLDWHNVFGVRSHSSQLDALLSEFQDVFQDRERAMSKFKAEVRVKEGATPLFYKPRPVPFALRDQVSTELDKLEQRGVITKIDSSDWAAPLVVVPKVDQSLRICGDYKVTINQVVQPDTYPLPNADDLFATLAGGEVFTKLDLSTAYQQLELTEDSKQYLVVNTQKGLYRYERLSYGVSTAPSIFQRVMDQILQGIEGVTCYLDDILISSSKRNHLDKVRTVLERLRKYDVQLKRRKCNFMMDKVTYLGHEVSAQGIQPTEEKVQAIRKMRAPTSLHELRVLLGMVNYYGKFLPNMSTLLAPWYALLKKDFEFKWTKACEDAFSQIKKLMTSDSVLVHYDPRKKLTIACDASPFRVGCVLSQETEEGERPVAYASRSLTAAEKNYCQLEREGLSIIFRLVKFHKYLFGRKFTILTDNKPISRILGEKTGIPSLAALRLQRWALILMSHDYQLKYRSASNHGNCDGLSRFPTETDKSLAQELPVNYFSYLDKLPIEAKNIADATRKNPVMAKVVDFVMAGWPEHCPDENLRPYFNRRNELSVDQGCLLWGVRVVIPPCFRERLLNELHQTHPGIVKMKALSRSYLWFPGLDGDIEDLVSACDVCQSLQKSLPAVPLIPWEYPSRCWERIHIDFAELQRRNYLIVVDAHSKWVEVLPITKITTHSTISELRKLFARFGLPEVLVSDNGPQLVSSEFQQFLKTNGIRQSLSPPYHPATNGAAERTVQTVKMALKKFILSNYSNDMDLGLQNFLLQYRVTPHGTTGRSPSELFLKRSPRTRFSLLKPDVRRTVSVNQEAQKRNHDISVAPAPSFAVGEIVRVKSTPQYAGHERYLKGVIAKQVGTYRFLVKIGNRCRYVHTEHLRKTGELNNSSDHVEPPLIEGVTPIPSFPVAPEHEPVPYTHLPAPPSTRDFLDGQNRNSSALHYSDFNQAESRATPIPCSTQDVPDVAFKEVNRKSSRPRRAPERLIETI